MALYIDGIKQPAWMGEQDVKAIWFETIGSGTTSGTVSKPAGAGTDVSFVMDEWGTATDALVSTINEGKPTYQSPVDASGDPITTTFNTSGEYTFSGTPVPAAAHALIYVYICDFQNYVTTEALTGMELVGDAVVGSDFDATSFLYATTKNNPESKTPEEVMAILSGESGAAFDWNSQSLSGVGGVVVDDGGTIGQAAGPLLTFDDTNNYLEITGCNVGIGTATPDEALTMGGTLKINTLDHTETRVEIRGGSAGTVASQMRMKNKDEQLKVVIHTASSSYFNGGNTGFGVTDPDTKVEILNAGDQLKLSFDGTDNAVFAVDTDGELTVTPSGDNINLASGVNVTTNIAVGTDSPSASFSGTGDIYATSGIKAMEGLSAEAVAYGAGLEIQDNGLVVTYTNIMTGTATLTAATQIIYDPEGSFDSTYVGQFFKVIGSTPDFTGATGEIIAVPSSTTLIVSFGSAGGDTIVDATAMSFVIYPEPRCYISDNGDVHYCIGENEDASFKICTDISNNEHAVHLVSKAGVDGNAALEIEFDPDTYRDCSAIEVDFDATAFADAGTKGTILDVIIDNVGASAGDVHAMDVALSDPANADVEIEAVATHEGVDVIGQYIGDPAAIEHAFITDTNGSITASTIAFNDAGPDTITDSGDGFVAAGFVAGQVITVTGDSDNNGTYIIATVAVGTITLIATDALSDEVAGDSVTINSTYRDVTTALGAAGTDVTLFDTDNDVLLLASENKWDEINVILDTEASHSITPTFHYIEDDGDWIQFYPADDTDGFSNSATVREDSDALTTWGERTLVEVLGAGAAVDRYWQRITRTRNVLPTSPVEDTLKVTTLGTKFKWDKDGKVNINTMSVVDGITAPTAISGQAIIYVDTADGDLKVKFGNGFVATIAADS